jgi:uncharacterized coiled-coil protein SlyX
VLDNGGAEEELNRERLESLRLEIERLRAEVARLRAKNAELVAEAVNRNYERPPHYQ